MNTKILLNERPHGEPNLGNFKTVKEEIRTPNNGEVLLKTISLEELEGAASVFEGAS